jgi:hypothetical protein
VNSDAEIANAAISPPTNVGLRNSVRSNIGSLLQRLGDDERDQQDDRGDQRADDVPEPQPSSLERISP